MNWIKLFYEARTDAKLKKLSHGQFRVWFNLLLFSAEQGQRGLIVAEDFYLLSLEVSDEDEALLTATLAILLKLKMISYSEEEGVHTIEFLHFEERQYDKPSNRPEAVRERVQRHRDTKKSPDVTPLKRDVTPCNATEKSREEQNRTEQNREEEIRDRTETETEQTARIETTAPPPTEPGQLSVPSVPSFGTGAFVPSVPSPEPARTQPVARNSDWYLSESDIRDLLKSRWTRQEIEWGVQIGIESGTKPRCARSVLHASILPDVREGKKPGISTDSVTHTARPEPEKPTPLDPVKLAQMEATLTERSRIRDAALALNGPRGGQHVNATQ